MSGIIKNCKRVTDRGWKLGRWGGGWRAHGKRNTCERIKKISNINARNIENSICTITRAMCVLRSRHALMQFKLPCVSRCHPTLSFTLPSPLVANESIATANDGPEGNFIFCSRTGCELVVFRRFFFALYRGMIGNIYFLRPINPQEAMYTIIHLLK